MIGLVIIFLITFIFASLANTGECNSQGQICTNGIDDTVSCSEDTNCEANKSVFGLATVILAASFLIYLAVTILMCLTLSYFNKLEKERKSHNYSSV